MTDTRETAYIQAMTEDNSSPRFKVGDTLLIPALGEIREQVSHTIFWDKEFGGWLVCCGCIGVHEQNYILASERDLWTPEDDGLWSYWTKSVEQMEASAGDPA